MSTSALESLPRTRASAGLYLAPGEAESLLRSLQTPSPDVTQALRALEAVLSRHQEQGLSADLRHLSMDAEGADLLTEPCENRLLAEQLCLQDTPLPEAALHLSESTADAWAFGLSLGGLLITPSRVSWMPLDGGDQPGQLLRSGAPDALEDLRSLVEPELGRLHETPDGRLIVVGTAWKGLNSLHPHLLPGLHLPDFEPQGEPSRLWRRLHQEIQMVWHGRPALRALAESLGCASLILSPWGAGPAEPLPGREWLEAIRQAPNDLPPGAAGWLQAWAEALGSLQRGQRLLVSTGAEGLVVHLTEKPAAGAGGLLRGLMRRVVGGAQPASDALPTDLAAAHPRAAAWLVNLLQLIARPGAH